MISFSEILCAIGVAVLLFLGLIAVVAVADNAFAKYQCANYQEITGIETKYAPFDICYVKTSTGFQRWDEYKMRAVTNEKREAK